MFALRRNVRSFLGSRCAFFLRRACKRSRYETGSQAAREACEDKKIGTPAPTSPDEYPVQIIIAAIICSRLRTSAEILAAFRGGTACDRSRRADRRPLYVQNDHDRLIEQSCSHESDVSYTG